MSAIINGSSPSVTFSDGTTQATSAIVSGYVPYANLPAGSVLQVVNATYGVETNSSSSTYADTGLTATITPKFATSKILILVSQNGCQKQTNQTYMEAILLRGSSSLIEFAGQAGSNGSSSPNNFGTISLDYLDSPATTSATTYKTQFKSGANLASVRVQNNGATSTITLMEIAA